MTGHMVDQADWRTHLGDAADELGRVLGEEQPGSEKVVVLGVREALRVRGREAVGDCLGFGQLEVRRRLQRCVGWLSELQSRFRWGSSRESSQQGAPGGG